VVSARLGRPRYRIYATEPQARIRAAVMLEAYGIAFSSTAMISKDVCDEVGPFDERLSISADITFAWRLAQRGAVLAVPEALALYRLHGRSQTHNDLDALEHDAEILIHEAFDTDRATLRRAHANLHTHLLFRHLMRGHAGRAVGHARRVMATDPSRLLGLPTAALGRRAGRRLLGHWPLTASARSVPTSAARR
jgi:GT2 family glycosyltransferase